MTKYLLAALLLFLSACRKDGPPTPTAEQSSQLNDAENLLDAMDRNEEGTQNEEGPEANASSPSNSSD
jgi:hypothetical protein